MLKFLKSFCLVGLLFLMCTQAGGALVKEKTSRLGNSDKIWVTSFNDYKPFASINQKQNGFDTIFSPLFETLEKQAHISAEYATQGTYKERLFQVVNGDIDIVIGAYYDSDAYTGIDMIYPALLTNPVTVVTMPYKTFNIKTRDDLQSLKGAIDSRELFSDHVSKQLEKLNLQKFDDSEKLYEQLFTGQIDYILTSRYYGALEQAKMGIREMVSMSKHALWDMPMFIGVSAITRKSEKIKKIIRKVLQAQQNELKEQFQQRIIDEIRETDEASQGVVPPSFVK